MSKHVHAVTRNGKTYHYLRAGQLRRHQPPSYRLSDDPEEAERQAALLCSIRPEIKHADILDHISILMTEGRKRAKLKGTRFTLSEPDVIRLVAKHGYRCAVSGLPFDLDDRGGNDFAFRRPFRPSLDRIDCSRGYVAGNVRVVCCAVNIALNEWGLDTLLKVSRAIVEQDEKRTAEENAKKTRISDICLQVSKLPVSI